MKILYLHQYFTPPRLPGGTRSWSLASRLVERGHEVHMITTDRSEEAAARPDKWNQTTEAGIQVHWTPVPYSNAMSYSKRIAQFFRFSFRAARRAREIGGDVVFATSTPLTIALPGVYASRRLRVPMVFEVRDLWPAVPIAVGAISNPVARFGARWLERFAYRNAERIVALAPGMKDAVAETGYPDDMITVIPNGADDRIIVSDDAAAARVRADNGWLADRKLVLYCGAIGLVNGVEWLARLAAKVRERDPEIRFAVIGDGAEKATLEDTAREFGVLDESLFVLGTMPKKDVAAWLQAANMTAALFTGPRIVWKDATQNKFFDSLAAGRPVACNFDGWQCQVAAEEGVGLVLDSKDIDKAATDLLSHLTSDEWMASASSRARELAATRFSMDSHAAKLEDVLTAAVAGQ